VDVAAAICRQVGNDYVERHPHEQEHWHCREAELHKVVWLKTFAAIDTWRLRSDLAAFLIKLTF
jgi:hypothetical protein